LNESFCLASSCARDVALSAISGGIYPYSNDGQPFPILGGDYTIRIDKATRLALALGSVSVFLPARLDGVHSNGATWRTTPQVGKPLYRFPQDKHIEPICLMSVSLWICVSRVEPAAEMTGPLHSLQVDADR
jgi:hypothetical protein